jgi:hypothetical protein
MRCSFCDFKGHNMCGKGTVLNGVRSKSTQLASHPSIACSARPLQQYKFIHNFYDPNDSATYDLT